MAVISGSGLSSAMSCCSTTASLPTKCCLPWSSSTSSPSSRRFARVSFSSALNSSSGSRGRKLVVALATEDPFDANKIMNDALKDIQEAWAKTEDKVALGSLGFSAFLTLWASVGVISAIDRLPLLPSFFELVGVIYSTWFAYRYLLFKPDREVLQKKVKDIWNEITGSKDIY